jgi:acetoin utilization deacetylase AcuC-like enzyme
MGIGIIREEVYLEHITDDYHPENPNRLRAIYSMLPGIDKEGVVYIPARLASHEEIALIHEQSYIESIARTQGKTQRRLDPDTVTSPRSYEAACTAVGGVLELIEAILRGQVSSGFALVRPPGHHAERGRAMGFCIFNNVAIGARYLQEKYSMKRILIVDWDLHHGNGTQHAFYDDPGVLYFSTHQSPYYPGTGAYEETGDGKGKGYTVNVPMSYGMGDQDYECVFREILLPVADQYKPEWILVSAGFDIHHSDPLGGMTVSEGGFAMMTRMLLDMGAKHCGGKVLFALEGGYDLTGLANSTKAVIMEMKETPLYAPREKDNLSAGILQTVARVKQVLKPYWGNL